MHDDITVSMTIRASTPEKGKKNDAEEATKTFQLTAIAFLTGLCSSFNTLHHTLHLTKILNIPRTPYNNLKMMDFETLAKSTRIPPGLTSSSSVGPVPTVIPGPGAALQEVHTTGKRTLWYVILHWMRVHS